MDLKNKLVKLRHESNLALFRWTASRSRVVEGYVMLSDIRFNALICDAGEVHFSSSVPLVVMEHGRSVVRYSDTDVVTIVSGRRRGINVKLNQVRSDEEAVKAARCISVTLDSEQSYPHWLESRVLSMGLSELSPSSVVAVPELFRLTREPGSLRPILSQGMIRWLGGTGKDSLDELRRKFVEKLENPDMGFKKPYGYLVPAEYVAVGGCCVASVRGMCAKAGSLVFTMPLDLFDKLTESAWDINRRWK